jgi:manganese oxidase
MEEWQRMTSTTMSGAARLWAAIATVAILLLGIMVALTYTGAAGAPAAPAGAVNGSAPGEGVTVEVELAEFAFAPSDISVPADTPVTFELSNAGSVPHDFVVEGVAASEVIAGGEQASLEVDGIPAGEYRVICEEAGHEAAGMTASLVATAEGAAERDGPHAEHEATPAMSAEEMAAKHDDLSAFPADTEHGGQPLEPEILDDGTKRFELVAEEIEWEVEPGVYRQAMAYNGQVPGPRIDVDLGDDIEIVLRNELSVPTSLHPHGLILPNAMDGVPGLTQDSVLPGEEFVYAFEAQPAGSHMYHSHFDSANQVPMGLLGALIIHDPDDPWTDEVDHDYVMILNDGPLGYTLNGKGFPATEPLVVERGETVRVRYMNEGLQIHPMHLHGIPQTIVARDGHPLEVPYVEDNVLISPGDRIDVIVEATEPGAWAWHCHILTHAEGPDGMFGMVTALIVEDG